MNSSWLKNGKLASLNTLRQLVFPVQNLVIAWLVVYFADQATWGQFVYWMVPVSIAVPIFSWGHKDYLLRKGSRDPAAFQEHWINNCLTRLLFPGSLLIILFISLSATVAPKFLWAWFLAFALEKTFEPAIHFRRYYGYVLRTDLFALALMVAGVYYLRAGLHIDLLIGLYVLAAVIKILLLSYKHINFAADNSRIQLDAMHIKQAVPFFLLGITGLLFSRMDLYTLNYLLPSVFIGQYQVLINLFLYQQALPGFVLMPFVKNIFRLNQQSITSLNVKFLGFGLMVLVFTIPASWLIINWGFAFALDWTYFAIGTLLILPVFIYSPLIYGLFRVNKEKQVVGVNITGALFNLAGNLLLIPVLEMKGALIAAAGSQWIALLFYLGIYRRTL